MPTPLLYILILLGVALFSQHLLSPIMVRWKAKISANPHFDVLAEDQVTGVDTPTFQSTMYQLEVLGFSLASHLCSSSDSTPKVETIISYFVNRDLQMTALITQMTSLMPVAKHIGVYYLEFYSEFKDGSEISTINSPMVQVFYDMPQKLIARIPHVKDVGQLYYIHSHLVGQRTSPPILPEPGHEAAHLSESMKKSLAQQAELGYLFLDKRTPHYRHTWKGAFRGTWRLLWPLKQIIERRQEAEGRRIAAAALAG